ncbi:glycosyltransferase [Actinokineospora spheciospongiae]|uniref:glycosyltransferase n=1 Tax=Actinokineospora spheciospongiae TaxID=909613 RepID=UPI000D7158F8|nr:glycosyltransferase [Actinokineospora spheciospongiae]PWW64084.1 teichuronic acid biosynthesis glycosyltransferase TuaH [Actinokineospora spheciospongiae]
MREPTTAPGDRRLVVVASGVTFDGVRGTERHLAERLTRYADVLWVDPPVSPATPRRYRGVAPGGRSWRADLREAAPGLHRLTPVVLPGLTRPGIRLTTWPLVRAQVRSALRELGRTPAAVIACSFDDVLGHWGDDVVDVLYGTDDWVAGAALMRQDTAKLEAEERRALAAADVVFTVSPQLAARWLRFGAGSTDLPNGCDPDAYARVPDLVPNPLPDGFPATVAGVVGQLSARIDIALLEAVADTGVGLLLVGPRDPAWEPERAPALLARPNVHAVGAVAFEELPGWLAAMHVGLCPYADTAFNRASFPLKTLEYLAADLPVVASELPAHRRLQDEGADLLVARDAEEFVAGVAAATRPGRAPRPRREVALRHSWAERARVFAERLGWSTVAGGESPAAGGATFGAASPMDAEGDGEREPHATPQPSRRTR